MTARTFRIPSLAALLAAAAIADDAPKTAAKKMQRPPRPGVEEPGVQSSMTELKPEAVSPCRAFRIGEW